MRICITARFKGDQNKPDIEALCAAVKAAGHEDFCFIRDIENYQKIFTDPKELWARAKEEISNCDALLIDISDNPTGGRVIEAGMAFGLGMPIFVIVKEGIEYKPIYDGIATKVIPYQEYQDIIEPLAAIQEN